MMPLAPIQHDLLAPVRHGFFTRQGGQSSGIYAGLNCGPGSRDDPNAVTENRAMVAAAMDVAPDHLISVYQVHSADVLTVTGPIQGDNRPTVDAMVTATPGVALGVLSADCAPILFHDPKARVIGAAHSGWKGTLKGIGAATLDAMEALGAERADTVAVIGPCISQRAYEVGPEFFEDFVAENPDFARFFAGGSGDRMQFDLPSFILAHLRDAGIGSAAWTGHCTFGDPARFYSYRRTTHAQEPDYGRLISTLRL